MENPPYWVGVEAKSELESESIFSGRSRSWSRSLLKIVDSAALEDTTLQHSAAELVSEMLRMVFSSSYFYYLADDLLECQGPFKRLLRFEL